MVVVGALDLLGQEREGHPVAGAVDDDVGLDGTPVGEEDLALLEPVDGRLDRDVAVPEPGEQVVAHGRVRLEDVVVGLGQPVVGDLADRQPQHRLHGPLLQRERTPGERRVGEVVGRPAEHELGHDVGPAAHREVGLLARPARTPRRCRWRSCRCRAPPRACPRGGRACGSSGRAPRGRGRSRSREAGLRPARVPVVAVGDQHVGVVVDLGLVVLVVQRADGHVVPAALGRLDLHHLGAEA